MKIRALLHEEEECLAAFGGFPEADEIKQWENRLLLNVFAERPSSFLREPANRLQLPLLFHDSTSGACADAEEKGSTTKTKRCVVEFDTASHTFTVLGAYEFRVVQEERPAADVLATRDNNMSPPRPSAHLATRDQRRGPRRRLNPWPIAERRQI